MAPYFTYSSPPSGDLPIHVTLAGWNAPSSAAEIRRDRAMDLFVFQYVEKGRGFLEVEGRRYDCSAGDVLVTPARSLHRYGPAPGDPWQKSWFNLQGALTEELLRLYRLTGINRFQGNETAGDLIRETVRGLVGLSSEEADDFAARQVLRIILSLKDQAIERRTGPCHPAVPRLLRLLRGHLRTPAPSLEEMSASVSLSPTHLVRVFRREYGMTPSAYLLSEKLAVAAEMLTASGATIGEISEYLGFANEFYFSRLFKKKKGMAPGLYRKMSRSRGSHG